MDERTKKFIIVVSIVVISLILSILLILFISVDKKENNDLTTTTTTKENNKDIFKGYKKYEVSFDKELTYNYQSRYEFVYGDTKKKTISTYYDGLMFEYDVVLENGILKFVEQRHNEVIEGLEYTGKTYEFKTDNKIVSFVVGNNCDSLSYTLVVLDSKSNAYMYESNGEEIKITYIISNIKKVKTISKIKEIGYYNLSNEPHINCDDYEFIYKDTKDNIRYITGKNELFFNSAYYRFIGANYQDQIVYVLKDGKMKYDIGNTENYLYDGNYHIKYQGSFYTQINEVKEDLYIIGTDGYLYYIESLSEESDVLLTKVNENKIKAIGTQIKTNNNDFATEELRIIIEFEDESIFKLETIEGFELLR